MEMKKQLINKQIGSDDLEVYEVRAIIKANNRSLSLHYCRIMNLPSLSHRKFQKIFCALKIPRGFFWKLNINKTV